jgi:hypothetical protein
MKKFLALFNVRTLITVLICLVASFVTIRYDLKLHQTTMLLGLLLVFPLVKSFQFAFKRRERSLEYLSGHRGALIAIHHFFQHTKKLPPEDKTAAMNMVIGSSEALLAHLKNGNPMREEVFRQLDQISLFMMRHEEAISTKISTLILRAMKEVYISTSFLMSICTHRTILVLRVFAQVFIGLFSLIQAPTLNAAAATPLAIYLITVMTGVVLTTLVNVQEHLENPFDQNGYDDIKLDEYGIRPTDLINEIVIPVSLPGEKKKKKDKDIPASETISTIPE